MTIRGKLNGQEQVETIPRGSFQWMTGGAVATSQLVFDSLGAFEVTGLERRDTITIQTLDLTGEDHTLFLPLWAEIPNQTEAELLVTNRLLSAGAFLPSLWRYPPCRPSPIRMRIRFA